MPVAVFCLFLVFQEISTKRSPNATKLFGDFFLDKRDPGDLERRPEGSQSLHKATGRDPRGGAVLPCGAHMTLFDLVPLL